MKIFIRFALSAGSAVAFLAGCALPLDSAGGKPAQDEAPPEGAASWMAPIAGNSDLLYVANTSYVSVYRYGKRNLAGTLEGFDNIQAACSDSAGNVYLVDEASEAIDEFAHGGTTAIDTFQDSPYVPADCSVNPLTGDLAVANTGEKPYGHGNVAIFPQGTGRPKIYTPPLGHYTGLAYDDQGNLLTTGGSNLAWLAAGARRLTRIKLRGSSPRGFGAIRWDGKYFVTLTNSRELTQVLVANGHGKVVGVTKLDGHGIAGGYAIYRKPGASQGTQVVGVYSNRSSFAAGEVEYWKYPAGGTVFATITGRSLAPTGVAISLKQ